MKRTAGLAAGVFPLWIERQFLERLGTEIAQILAQSFVREVNRARMFPIMIDHAPQPAHDFAVVHFDGQLAPFVKTSRSQIHRAHNGSLAIGDHQLCMQLHVVQLMHLDPHVIEHAHSLDALQQLLFLQVCGARAITRTSTPRIFARTRRSRMTGS